MLADKVMKTKLAMKAKTRMLLLIYLIYPPTYLIQSIGPAAGDLFDMFYFWVTAKI